MSLFYFYVILSLVGFYVAINLKKKERLVVVVMETIIPTVIKIIGAISGAGIPFFWMKSNAEAPDLYAVHSNKIGYAKKIADTHALMVSDGFNHAVKKLLKDGKHVDFSRLDDSAIQQDFAKTMTDFYITQIKDEHGFEAKDDFHKQMLLQAYAGITTSQLQDLLKTYGGGLDYNQFGRVSSQLNQGIRDNLYLTSSDHIADKDIKEISQKLGLEDKLRPGEKFDLKEIRELLNKHVLEGGLNEATLRGILKGKYKGNPPPVEAEAEN